MTQPNVAAPMLTPNQIHDRPKWKNWTPELIKIALGGPDDRLDKKYHYCPLYLVSRIELLETGRKLVALRIALLNASTK